MNKVLAIDYGTKRVGLAVTDSLRISINPLPTILAEQLDSRLAELLGENEISDVIYGISYHADGTLTHVGDRVQKRVKKEQILYPDCTFHMIDEAFTSVRAKEMMHALGTKKKKRREKGTVDSVSALLILKDFLDSV